MPPGSQSDSEMWAFVRQRLIDEGLTPERAETLATALLDPGLRPGALQELDDRLDRLTDVTERLETHRVGAHERFRHPIRSAEHDFKHMHEIAEEGQSGATPAILTGRVILILIPIAAIMMGLAVGAFYLASDDDSDSVPWSLPNGDLVNTRNTRATSISSSNVSELGVAWTMPLTASSIYGTFAANPVTSPDGIVYLQDLESNVFAVDLETGSELWRRAYNSQSIGPNGVTYADGRVYGATAEFAFALDAKTGEEVWRNTTLVPESRQEGGGELASGFGIDIQPLVANGAVYLSSAALLGGGEVFALDAATGETRWSFDTVIDPLGEKIIGGGAWYPPALGPDGTVYIGTGNMYQPPRVGISQPGKRLYTDSLLALDGETGKLRWYFQAVPNDFYDWDMHLSPIYAESEGRALVVGGGKMGYIYALDAGSGELVWKTKVGTHNGHDADPTLALQRKLTLRFPLTVEPGIFGGVETPLALADGVIYVPVANLASEYESQNTDLGSAKFGDGKGEMVALDLATGGVLWDTKLSQMPDGAATVANDLVFTTTFDGYLVALERDDGSIAWRKKLPAFTNAPVAIVGDTLITAASFPGGKGQTTQVVAFRLGASGSFGEAPGPAPGAGEGGAANGASLFGQECASCHVLAVAGSTGTVGPNLDDVKPSKAAVAQKVTDGGGGMPAFGGRLSGEQIDAIATYVARSADKG